MKNFVKKITSLSYGDFFVYRKGVLNINDEGKNSPYIIKKFNIKEFL